MKQPKNNNNYKIPFDTSENCLKLTVQTLLSLFDNKLLYHANLTV